MSPGERLMHELTAWVVAVRRARLALHPVDKGAHIEIPVARWRGLDEALAATVLDLAHHEDPMSEPITPYTLRRPQAGQPQEDSMPLNSRCKGAGAERELAAALFDELGVKLVRNLEQSRRGGHDLTLDPGEIGPVAAQLGRYAFEVKRHAKAPPALVKTWWSQAAAQASAAGLVPALAYRPDRGDWRFVLPLVELHPGLTRAPGVEFTAELSLEGFAALVREIAE